MPRVKKFRQGAVYRRLGDFARDIYSGRWVYVHHKPMHPVWMRNLSFYTVIQYMRAGALRRAISTEKLYEIPF